MLITKYSPGSIKFFSLTLNILAFIDEPIDPLCLIIKVKDRIRMFALFTQWGKFEYGQLNVYKRLNSDQGI